MILTIRQAREQAGLTLDEVAIRLRTAHRLKLDPASLSRIERGFRLIGGNDARLIRRVIRELAAERRAVAK